METAKQKGLLKHLDFIVADVFILQVSYWLANLWYSVVFEGSASFSRLYYHQAVILLLCITLSLVAGHPYNGILKRDKYQEIAATTAHTLKMAGADVIFLYFIHESGNLSRIILFMTWVFYFILEICFRLVWKRLLRHHILVNRPDAKSAFIIVTTRNKAHAMVTNLHCVPYSRYFIKAIFLLDYDDKKDAGTQIDGIPVLGSAKDSIEYSANHWVDEVIINLRNQDEEIKNIQQHFSSMGITTHQVIFLLHNDTIEGYERIDKFGKYIVETHQIRYVPLIKWWLKRFFDIIGALVGLAITGILFIIIAPQIYHADPGPVIYTSIRIGKNGRQFKFYKFRSMYQDADVRKAELMSQNKVNGLMFKIDNDPRIIPGIGNFIRKTSLDEFPQFWNVLKGNMSLVGTRPPTLDEWQQYEEGHRIRMSMRPGITGIWQVSGRSSITDFNEVVKMDEEYIETWSLSKDFFILLKTVGKVFKREGAE